MTVSIHGSSSVDDTDHDFDTRSCVIGVGTSTCQPLPFHIIGDLLGENNEKLIFEITDVAAEDVEINNENLLNVTIEDDDSCTPPNEQILFQVKRDKTNAEGVTIYDEDGNPETESHSMVTSVINIDENPVLHYNLNNQFDSDGTTATSAYPDGIPSSTARQEFAHHDAITFFVTKFSKEGIPEGGEFQNLYKSLRKKNADGWIDEENTEGPDGTNVYHHYFKENTYSLWFIFDQNNNNCVSTKGGMSGEGGWCYLTYKLTDMPVTSKIVVADDNTESDTSVDFTDQSAEWTGAYKWNNRHDGVLIDFGLDTTSILELTRNPSFEVLKAENFDGNGTERRYMYRNEYPEGGEICPDDFSQVDGQRTQNSGAGPNSGCWSQLAACGGGIIQPLVSDKVVLNLNGSQPCTYPMVAITEDTLAISVQEGTELEGPDDDIPPGDGVRTEFPLPFFPNSVNEINVYVNDSVRDNPDDESSGFSVSGETLIFNTAPIVGATIRVVSTAYFNLRLGGGFNNGFDVDYAVTYGEGADASDVQAIGTCSFRAREENQVCKIEIVADDDPEENEIIEIQLEDGPSYNLIPGEAMNESELTIINDD